MRGFVPVAVAGILAVSAAPAVAQTGFYLPTAVTSSGQDEFRAADGTTCRSTMDGAKRIELGTFGSAGRNDGSTTYGTNLVYGSNTPMNGNAGVYGRVTISLDARRDRIDCTKLFNLEMERRQLEIEMMKRSLVSQDRKLDDVKARAPGTPSRKPVRLVRNAPPP